MSKLPTLKALLKYNNRWVVERYKKDYPDNQLSGKQAFREMLKFLWLSQKHKHDLAVSPRKKSLQFVCGVHHEMDEIDDMWHTFLLFTQDYAAFCKKYFGQFVHHAPNTKKKRISKAVYKTDIERYFSYIYEQLGEKTLKVWFRALLEQE